jgi:TonB family protein
MINKKLIFFFIFLFSFLSLQALQAAVKLEIKLRFYGSMRGVAVELPQVITSSYLYPTVSASIQSEAELVEEKKQIQRVFNLLDVSLITEADLPWSEGLGKISHVIRLDSKEYLILITPLSRAQKNQFRIEVFEQKEMGKSSLLDTEFILPEGNIAVFGFEDMQGNPYFLSLRFTYSSERVEVGVEGGVEGGVRGGVAGEIEAPIRAIGKIKPPRCIKEVNPIYPEEARKAEVEGVVILSVTTDIYGKVQAIQVLKSIPLLDQAAIDAIKQWVYEPMLINGKPHPMVFTVTVGFRLK